MRSLGTILVELVLGLAIIGAIGAGVWFGGPLAVGHFVGAHDRAVLANATVGVQTSALTADTASSSRARAARVEEGAIGERAGRLIADKESAAAQNQPVDLNADDIRMVWGETPHAP